MARPVGLDGRASGVILEDMLLEPLIDLARAQGASDLHLQAGLPATLRVRGELRPAGEPLPGQALLDAARTLLGLDGWETFLERRSADVATTLQGVRCRVNLLCTSRGVGLAIRLLLPWQASLERLNLHPDLKRVVRAPHGLVLVSGPTGCGKSSTLAALLEEVNRAERRHVVTIESPIEYVFSPRLSLIRQREVGRDTPSFEQGLRDALREDPDVIMVGELRDPETMRLTLEAAETGHLVLATMHASSSAEALARIRSAFPPETQEGIAAQLADALVAVICQRLRWRPDVGTRVPECEVLIASTQARAMVRQGQFFKLPTALETGKADGCWTFERYREWLDRRTDWFVPPATPAAATATAEDEPVAVLPPSAPLQPAAPRRATPALRPDVRDRAPAPKAQPPPDGILSIDDADEDLDGILSELDRK